MTEHESRITSAAPAHPAPAALVRPCTFHESRISRVPRHASRITRCRGFTLLELMIVVTVIAVLSAIAIPNYRQYVLRSHRSEAIIALTELANLQEKFYGSTDASGNPNNRYVITAASIRPLLFYPTTTPSSYYLLTVGAPGGGGSQGYTLTATYSGTQTSDKACKTFTLDNAGRKGATDSTDASSTAITQKCWDR